MSSPSAARYAVDVAGLAGTVLPWAAAGWGLRRRLLPATGRASARLAEVVFALSGLVVVVEVVGGLGHFQPAWVLACSAAVACLVTGLALAAKPAGRPVPATPAGTGDPRRRHRAVPLAAAALAAAAVTAQWLSGTAAAYHHGITSVESLHYHLAHPAYFVQTGTLWRLHEVSAGSDAAFHPLNVELLHGLGMLFLRSDVISVFVNVLLLWLVLLAAWVFGERFRAGPAALCAAAVLLVSLPLGGSAGGTALNDVGLLAFVVAGAAFLVPAPSAGRGTAALPGYLAAGLALGLAAGSKLSGLAVTAALVGFVALSRRRWLPSATLVVGATALTGCFWYIRNWVLVGNPVPTVNLEVGGFGLARVPMPALHGTDFAVAHYLTDGHVLRHWFGPGLHADFGPVWPLVLLLPLAGVLLAFRPQRPGSVRVVAAAAVFAFAVYLVTPTGAMGLPGQPVLFATNVRYAMPALVLGVLLLVTEPWLVRRQAVAASVLLAIELVSLAPDRFWVVGDRTQAIVATLVAAVVVAVLAAARRWGRTALATGCALGLVAAAAAGLPVERSYLRHRYAAGSPGAAVWTWADTMTGARIGAVGFPTLYPLYGAHFQNRVQYVGRPGPGHAFDDYTSCAGWVDALRTAGYGYVVVLPRADGRGDYQRFAAWTRDAGGAPILSSPAATVFRVGRPLSAASCPR